MNSAFQIAAGFDFRLTQERQRLGLSRATLSGQLYISAGTLWRLETGRSSASVELLTGLQKLQFDIRFLLTGSRADQFARMDDDEGWGEAAQAVTRVMASHGLQPSPSSYWRLVRLLHTKVLDETSLQNDPTGAIEQAGRLLARPD